VRRSTGPETVETPFQRVAEPYALPATVSLTMMEMSWSSPINSLAFSSGTYRACATIAGEVANMLSLPPPTFPLSLPVGERKGARGKVRPPGVRRSTGPETVETPFQRVAEPYALPATVSLTMMEMLWLRLIKSPFLITI
jgi:hypothetical protein